MPSTTELPGDGQRPTAPRRSPWWFVVLCLAVAASCGALVAFLGSETALRLAIGQIERASGGRLRVEEPTGSLLDTIRAERIAWSGPTGNATANDVALDWSPRALWSRRVAIKGLGIRRLDLEIIPAEGATSPPASLALPIEVELDSAAVGRLDWRLGERRGTITGLAFGYSGGAREHQLRDLKLVFERGALAGTAILGASTPFPLAGTLTLTGDASLWNAQAEAKIGGTLADLRTTASGRLGEASFTADAQLSPLADPLLRSLDGEVHDLDLAAFDATLPATRIDASIHTKPTADGLAGSFRARNASPGAWDQDRVPLATLDADFTLSRLALALTAIDASLASNARASGQITLFLAKEFAAQVALDVANLDLAQLHTQLVTTRLRGRLTADLAEGRQDVVADLAQHNLAFALAASVKGTRIDVTRLRARANGGEFSGRGNIDLERERPFAAHGTFVRFDPSRFGRFPAGSINGSLALTGSLAPSWRASGQVALAVGSKLANVAIAGTAKGIVAPGLLRDASIDLSIGSGRVTATGNVGAVGDRLAFKLDAPKLADYVAIAPDRLPASLSGAIRASGTLLLEPGGPGLAVDMTAERARYDASLSTEAINAHVELAPGGSRAAPVDLAHRNLAFDIDARGVKAAGREVTTLHAAGQGTLADHQLSARLTAGGISLNGKVHGSARRAFAADRLALAWSGSIDELESKGRWPFRLEAPAPIAYGAGKLEIGATSIALADGEIRLESMTLDQGRLATRGSFTGVALATAAHLAAVKLPLGSDLKLGGEWSIAATPRWNGTIAIRRERGDLYASDVETIDNSDVPFGITQLEVDLHAVEDAIDARATLRSTLAGNADGTLLLNPAPGAAPRDHTGDTSLKATLVANLATLAPLQPWLGTTAVIDGRARLEASAQGRLADPALRFQLAVDSMRIDAPQYGISLSNGRLRAHDQGSDIVLSEFSIDGGGGRFTASGVLASLGRAGKPIPASGRVTWKAEHFRVLNRPDLRLVVDGNGTLAIEEQKLVLRGSLKADEGRIEYTRTAGDELSSDVVIVGRDFRRPQENNTAAMPLILDLELDLGKALTFSGEGLQTDLRGRVRVTTAPDGRLLGRGQIFAVNGTYFAFGQRLAIQRGRLIFDGPLDNPALDIVALRRNQAVEAGVAVTGTVKVPVITLTSNPSVPDSEKLAWLILGRNADSGSGADAAALQVASAALLAGRDGKPLTTRIAQSLGLDDITFGSSAAGQAASRANAGANAAAFDNQVIMFGKRLSDRLSIVYQQGLTVANNALRLEYSLTRTLTLRAEAGVVSSIGIAYRRTYD